LKHHIPDHVIEDVRLRADLVQVVSEHVQLKKSGKDYKGLCPFHPEKTPSFTVSAEKQFYHCFGCGAGGNVIKFLMDLEDLSFIEAIRKLADRVGVTLPSVSPSPHEREVQTEREMLYKLNTLAMEYFVRLLQNPEGGQAARAYLGKREFDTAVAERFQIGYASASLRDLTAYLEKTARCSRAQLEKAGLAKKREHPQEYVDRFRNRIMFPLKDARGKIVGFAGRALGEEIPKYLNSPETLLYKKSQHLFGLDLAREAIRKEDSVLLVEGHFDLVRLFQHGIANAVATCGTALTALQIGLIRNYTRNVVLVFDSDAAGQAASRKGYDLLLEQEMNVKILTLPQGHDPDSFLQDEKTEKFMEQVRNAPPFIESYIKETLKQENIASPDGRIRVVNRVLPMLGGIKNHLERTEWIKFLAEQTGVDAGTLLAETKKNLISAGKTKNVALPPPRAADRVDPAVYLIHLMLAHTEAARRIREQVTLDDFSDPLARTVAGTLFRLVDEGFPVEIGRAVDRIENEEARKLLTQIGFQLIEFENPIKAAQDCIRQIRREGAENKIRELKTQRNKAMEEGLAERSRELQKQLQMLEHSLAVI